MYHLSSPKFDSPAFVDEKTALPCSTACLFFFRVRSVPKFLFVTPVPLFHLLF